MPGFYILSCLSADAYIVHADPALFRAAPGHIVDGKLRQNLDLVTAAYRADRIILGARAAADVDIITGNRTGSRAVTLGAVDVNIVQADPAILGAAPGRSVQGDLLQNIDSRQLTLSRHRLIGGARAAADIQLGTNHKSLGGLGAGGAV